MKKIATHALTGILAFGLGFAIRSNPLFELRASLSKENWEEIQRVHQNYHTALTALYKFPSLQTASDAQRASRRAFDTYYLYAPDSMHIRKFLLGFCNDSQYCIQGLKKVRGHENYISSYTSRVQWRINLANDILVYGIGSQQVWNNIMKEQEKGQKNLTSKLN